MVVRRNTVIHTPEEIVRIRRAAQLTAGVRDEVARLAVPGMTTRELDDLAGSLIAATGGESAFLGYGGFPGNICISVNDEVVHGIGRPDRVLLPTDIVSIDLGVRIDGACGDTAVTFGRSHPQRLRLLESDVVPFGWQVSYKSCCRRKIQRVNPAPRYVRRRTYRNGGHTQRKKSRHD